MPCLCGYKAGTPVKSFSYLLKKSIGGQNATDIAACTLKILLTPHQQKRLLFGYKKLKERFVPMLTDLIIQKAKPKKKQYRLSDGNGLSLLVYPTGGKAWRYRYCFAGKESMISLGIYPDVSIEEARKRLAEARTTKALGTNPSYQKLTLKQALITNSENTFELIAREWHEKNKLKWGAKHAGEILRRLEYNLFPILARRPIRDIKALEFLSALQKVEERGALYTVKRCRQTGSQIFRYAVITGRAEHDVTADIKDGLKATLPTKHHNHIEPHELPEFMMNLESYRGKLLTKLAIHFLLLTFVRTGELRGARWDEIHEDRKLWIIPKERMKMKRDHLVPLSRQAMDVLTQIKKISGHTSFLFPGANNPRKMMSENTILFALARMGYQHKATGHGFRSTASTALNDMGFNRDYIEMQLAHAERNPSREPYNRAKYLPQREHMMQHWADFLDAVSQKDRSANPWDFRVTENVKVAA